MLILCLLFGDTFCPRGWSQKLKSLGIYLHPTIKGLFPDVYSGSQGWAAEAHSSFMLQSLWAQAAGGGKLRWKQDPSAKALGLWVKAARLEIPMGRARLFKCSPCVFCRLVFWGKAIQNPLLPPTSPINSRYLLLFFQPSTERALF